MQKIFLFLIFLNASKQNITPKYGRDKGNCHHFVITLLQKNIYEC